MLQDRGHDESNFYWTVKDTMTLQKDRECDTIMETIICGLQSCGV